MLVQDAKVNEARLTGGLPSPQRYLGEIGFVPRFPKGQAIGSVRKTREEIRARVLALLAKEHVLRVDQKAQG